MTDDLLKAISSETNGQEIKSLKHAFDVIEEIKQRDGARLTELVEATEMSSSSVHKHLMTLVESDFVTKEGDEYRVGLRFLEMGAHAREQVVGSKEIEMKARELAERTEETIEFTTHEHGRAVVLFRETGRRGVLTEGKVGKRFYIHQCAAGKAILAELPDETIEQLIEHNGLPPMTEDTITDRERLFDEVGTIRERGFATNNGESTAGLRAVAVPLLAPDDSPIGAFAVAGPKHRMGEQHLTEELPDLIKSVVTELELNLAHS
jgi:DNA-binding IclR family transcriptional regulator